MFQLTQRKKNPVRKVLVLNRVSGLWVNPVCSPKPGSMYDQRIREKGPHQKYKTHHDQHYGTGQTRGHSPQCAIWRGIAPASAGEEKIPLRGAEKAAARYVQFEADQRQSA
ncbi:MAG: hypothetical protein Ct9H300mP16_18560 [Pseudomonadota bacterium]|nr:MAG: hypothetical protein Ct9H300mP16_18560 [Pseudomonadota bacterium]